MRIDVTADDIAKGAPSECDSCPIALAIERVTGHKVLVRADRAYSYGPHPYGFSCYLPMDAQRFLANFDSGGPVQPFAFDVTNYASGKE